MRIKKVENDGVWGIRLDPTTGATVYGEFPRKRKVRVYFFASDLSTKARRLLLPEALERAGIDPALAATAKWSSRGGCSCGCSPAFIVEAVRDFDVFVKEETALAVVA